MEKKKKREGFFGKNILGEINDVPDALVDIDGENSGDKKKIKELEERLKVAREEKAAFEIMQDTKEQEMKNALDALKAQNKELQTKVETVEIEKQTLRRAADNTTRPSMEHYETIEALKQENKRVRELLMAAEAENKKLQESLSLPNEENEELKKKVEQLEREREQMMEAAQVLREENQKVIAMNEEVEHEKERLRNEAKNELARSTKLKEEVEQLTKENEELKVMNDQLLQDRSEEEVEIITSENKQLKQENNRLKVRIKGLEESTSSKLELHEQEMKLKRDREALDAEIFKSQQEIGEVLLNAQKQGSRTIERAKVDAEEIIRSANEELQTIKSQVKDISLEVEESKQSVVGIYSELQSRIRKMTDDVNEVG